MPTDLSIAVGANSDEASGDTVSGTASLERLRPSSDVEMERAMTEAMSALLSQATVPGYGYQTPTSYAPGN